MAIRVEGIKITKDHKHDKVLYEKEGNYYIRNATDGFKRGKPVQSHVVSYFTKYGFRKIDGRTPVFRDGRELRDNIDKFEIGRNHSAKYSG